MGVENESSNNRPSHDLFIQEIFQQFAVSYLEQGATTVAEVLCL